MNVKRMSAFMVVDGSNVQGSRWKGWGGREMWDDERP